MPDTPESLDDALAADSKEFGKIDLGAFRENQKERAQATGNKRPASKPSPIKAAVSPSRPTNLAKALAQTYQRIGAILLIVDQPCGTAIIDNANDMAASLDELAKGNPKVKKALEGLIATSAWGNVAMAHMPIILAISMHHSQFARERMGAVAEAMVENAS